ncbi:MAG: CHAT domain-containing protein [Bacteroidales bacterium]|nr:CHAT domain-containing protein [Bacteroidales bacterium]
MNKKYIFVKDSYNSLLDSLELYYPKYFKLRYEPSFILPHQVQQAINHNECLVEYVLSDSILTTFVIDKENIQVLNHPIDTNFADLCKKYLDLLQNQDFSNNVQHTYQNYTALGRYFYDILVAPVLDITDSREITFVPDGAIMYLPFESFITSDEFDKTRPNYRDLPYLIYDLSVGYSYSSTLLFSERVRSKSPNNKVLAFAPEYQNLLDEKLQSIWNRQSERDFLMPLPGAREEVMNISKTVNADIYLDAAASEANFKALASDYAVLHLAMHTIMDDKNPMYSKLAFTRNFSDSTQDHDLFTYEIYNLLLNAEMVVLSSCSSGYGELQKGEGMMSMARGFIYAGCPSIVMTLWQVSDLSSAELMSGFYKHLKKGHTKKKALRQAKIDYIKSSDNLKANPYFWSAFLMVGDSSPLYAASASFYLVLILVLFTLVILGVIYRKQIRKALGRKK